MACADPLQVQCVSSVNISEHALLCVMPWLYNTHTEVLSLLQAQSNGEEQEGTTECDNVGSEHIHLVAKNVDSPGDFGHQRGEENLKWSIDSPFICNYL